MSIEVFEERFDEGIDKRFEESLSSAQMGIWLGQQLNQQSPMYNAAEYIDLIGPLNTTLFERSLRSEIAKCVALQLQFLENNGDVIQRKKISEWQLNFLDFSNEACPLDKAQAWMQNCLETTIHLDRDQLFTQALIKLSDNHHVWFQKIHHIASDGFGFYLLTQAIAERYTQLTQLTRGSDHSKTIDTVDHLSGFRRIIDEDLTYRRSSAYVKDLNFWQTQLENHQRAVSLSAKSGAIADQHIRISSVIDKATFTDLKTQAQGLGLNWSDVIAACLALTIYQRTGTQKITIGLPVMNRLGSASLKIPSMVMNIIPIDIQFETVTTFVDLIKNIATTISKCRAHQRFRYETMKSEVLAKDKHPLFGPVLNIMPFDRQLNFNGLKTNIHNLSAGPVEDISFAYSLCPNHHLNLTIDANPNRYNQDDIADIHKHLSKIIVGASTSLESPVHMIRKYLSILEAPPLPKPRKSVLISFLQNAIETPSAIAIQADGKILTYAQVAERVATLSLALTSARSGTNSIVALVLPRSTEAVIAMLTCLLCRATFVCIDPYAPIKRNRKILSDADPDILWSEEVNKEYCATLLTADTSTTIYCDATLLAQSDDENREDWREMWARKVSRLNTSDHNNAYVIYTSGSTGTPKGVAVSYRALSDFVTGGIAAYEITPRDRVLQFAPLQFDACIEEIFITLAQGGTLVLRNNQMLESMQNFVMYCSNWRISVLDLPTAFWHELVVACTQSSLSLPSCIRLIIIGGEAVNPERVTAWRALYGSDIQLLNTYGPSEATVVATYADLSKSNSLISIGSPIAGRTCAVVDDELQPVAKGRSGELLLLGAGLAEGYVNQDSLTENLFTRVRWNFSGYEKESQRAYRTGDLVRINQENEIEYIGRVDNQFKVSGYRIEPTEIETALATLPQVSEVAITLIKGKGKTTVIVAHICSNKHWDIASLRNELRMHLPEPMLPSKLYQHNRLPKNTSGKIDRKQLHTLSNHIDAETVESNEEFSDQQSIIAKIWADVLGHQSISLDDNFFDLGGQSLQTIQVANRLSNHLSRNIEVALLFKHPTIRALTNTLFNTSGLTQPETNVHTLMQEDCAHFEASFPSLSNTQKHSASKQQKNDKQKTILLTGASGFVGAQLLHYLISETQNHVICCVRASNKEMALQKISQALSIQGLNSEQLFSKSSNDRRQDRASILLCDLEKQKIGLDAKTFSDLGAKIDCIIHNAANTSIMRDYQSLRKVNALSTGELLHLAAINHATFNLVSTIAVAQKSTGQSSTLPEDYIDQHPGLNDGYQQSKWVSERLAQIASTKGYPVNTYRLARVTGSAESAYVNPKDLIWSVLQAGLPIRKLPQLTLEEPWTAVDKVSQFIIKHSLSHQDNGAQGNCVFNLMPKRSLSFSIVMQWLAEKGLDFTALPLDQWCREVKMAGPEEHHVISEFFMQHASPQPNAKTKVVSLPTIIDEQFRAQSETYRVSFPHTTQALFYRYYAFAQKHYQLNLGADRKALSPTDREEPLQNLSAVKSAEEICYER